MVSKFLIDGYKTLTEKEIFNLSTAAHEFTFLIYNLSKNENITNFVNAWMLEDPIQMKITRPCGLFQLYFYKNVFLQDETSKLQSYKKLTNADLETIINNLFTLDQENNK